MAKIQEYERFGALWQQHLRPYKALFTRYSFPCLVEKKSDLFELDEVVHLPDWPENAKTDGGKQRSGKIDILVHARERFETRPNVIVESKIKVSYFRRPTENHDIKPLSTIRFDYDIPIRASHPLFHLHCSTEPVQQPDPKALPSWKYNIKTDTSDSHYPFRVPTPHMNLCSVLLGLVAEHLVPQQFYHLWKALEKDKWTPPLPNKDHLWKRCNPTSEIGVPFHSGQWYFWPEDQG